VAETAFIVRVPEVEALVGSLRERFDSSVGLGVPAHITVLAPFMPPEEITPAVLEQVRSALSVVPAFTFSLARVARFPATAYLAPEPSAPFVAMTQALSQRFLAYPPFKGEHAGIIPHLTVANGNAKEAECAAGELEERLRIHGPVRGTCTEVVLLENSSGTWKEMHVLALTRRDA
jgi:2'-5' RNA ligase